MENNKDNKETAKAYENPFNDPFKSGLLKEDALDIIMKDKDLVARIMKIKF